MNQHSFSKYKRTLSFVLCLTYILHLPILCIAHYFMESTSASDWVFFVGFGGLNILLIFIVNFFHKGMPKTISDFCHIMIYLFMSGCCFYTLYWRAYWMTIVMSILITIISLTFRLLWNRNFFDLYSEGTDYLKEESSIRLSIYLLPTIFMVVICNHIENAVPDSSLSLVIHLIFFVIAFEIITTTYLLWYKNTEKTISYKQLMPEIIWLFISFLIFIVSIQYLVNTVFSLILPVCGIVPILIRHKRES